MTQLTLADKTFAIVPTIGHCLKLKAIGVDLIGFAGRFAEAMSLERHLALGRAGIRLFPLSLLEWEVKKEEVLDTIERWLAQETRS